MGVRDYLRRLLGRSDAPDAAPAHTHLIDLAPDETTLVVTYGDYVGGIPVTPDPWQKIRGERLALALRASHGADPAAPRVVGYENSTGLLEDDYHWYECRLAPTAANVAALRACGLPWTKAAEAAAGGSGVAAEAVEAVKAVMVRLAAEDHAAVERFMGLARRMGEVDPDSDEGRALKAEVARLAARMGGPTPRPPEA